MSPSGDLLLIGSKERTALWTLDGVLVMVLPGIKGRFGAGEFSPSGDRVVTTSEDGTARVWLTRPEDLLKVAEKRAVGPLTSAEFERYGGLLPEEVEEYVATTSSQGGE